MHTCRNLTRDQKLTTTTNDQLIEDTSEAIREDDIDIATEALIQDMGIDDGAPKGEYLELNDG